MEDEQDELKLQQHVKMLEMKIAEMRMAANEMEGSKPDIQGLKSTNYMSTQRT